MTGVKTWFRRGLDQDWVDSVNGFWSVLLLAVCSVGAFLARYFTDPITCFTPPQFTGFHDAFAKQVCFMRENDYLLLPQEESISPLSETGISYHLWVPIILFFQALCFKIPNFIWNTGKHCLSLNLDETVETLKKAQTTSNETRQSLFHDAARVLGKFLESKRVLLGLLYLFVKLLFCVNLMGQFIFLTLNFRNSLIMRAENFLGLNVTKNTHPLFHKLILCDFKLRALTNVHHYTVQCVLPITEIYEKLFVFLWYWVLLLAVISVFNLLVWAGFLFLPFLRDSRITAYIKASPGSPQDSSVITSFISGFLGINGVLVLSMIAQNSSELVAANLSQQLHQVFLEKGSGNQPGPSSGETTASPPEVDGGTVAMETVQYTEGNKEKPPIV